MRLEVRTFPSDDDAFREVVRHAYDVASRDDPTDIDSIVARMVEVIRERYPDSMVRARLAFATESEADLPVVYAFRSGRATT
jgi:hypothetical protein